MDQSDIRDIEIGNADQIGDVTSVGNANNQIAIEFDCEVNNTSSEDLFNVTDEISVMNSTLTSINESNLNEPSLPVINIFVTPTQNSKYIEQSRSSINATIPSIPVSLIPFISLKNESWSSDLETPRANIAEQFCVRNVQVEADLPKSCEHDTTKKCNLVDLQRMSSSSSTPHGCTSGALDSEAITSSPILNTKKKRRPKRRIVNSMETTIPINDFTDQCDFVDATSRDKIDQQSNEVSDKDIIHDSLTEQTDQKDNNNICNTIFTIDGHSLSSKNRGSDTKESCTIDASENHCDQQESEDIFFNDTIETEVDHENIFDKNINSNVIEKNNESISVNEDIISRLEKLKQLERNQRQLQDHNYVAIPLTEFTKGIEALKSIVMPLRNSDSRLNVTKQLDFVPFSKLHVVNPAQSDINKTVEKSSPQNPAKNSPVKFKHATKSLEFCSDATMFYGQRDPENINDETIKDQQTVNVTKITDISAGEYVKKSEATDIFFSPPVTETPLDTEEFSEWLYESNEATVPPEPKKPATIVTALNTCQTEISQPKSTEARIDIAEYQDSNGETKIGKENPSLDIQDLQTNGFSTASGRPIAINKDRLMKAVEMYNACNATTEDNTSGIDLAVFAMPQNTKSLSMCSSMKRKSDHDVRDPDQYGDKLPTNTDNMYKKTKIDFSNENDTSLQILDKPSSTPTSLNLCEGVRNTSSITRNNNGFTTASGKSIQIKESSLKKALAIFSDDENNSDSIDAIKYTSDLFSSVTTNQSENDEKTREINSAQKNADDKIQSCTVSTPFSDFRTACGKSLRIDQSALNKAKALFDAEFAAELSLENKDTEVHPSNSSHEPENKCHAMNQATDSISESNRDQITTGFSTARGGAIRVSNQSLLKAKMLAAEEENKIQFDSTDRDPKKEESGEKMLRGSSMSEKASFSKQQTARVPVTRDDIAVEARETFHTRTEVSLLEGCKSYSLKNNTSAFAVSTQSEKAQNNSIPTPNTGFVATGFHTASGGAIQVTNEAFLKGKKIVEEVQGDQNLDPLHCDFDDEENLKKIVEGFPQAKRASEINQATPKGNPLKEINHESKKIAIDSNYMTSWVPVWKSSSENSTPNPALNVGSVNCPKPKLAKSGENFQLRKQINRNLVTLNAEKENARTFYPETRRSISTPTSSRSAEALDAASCERNEYRSFVKKRTDLKCVDREFGKTDRIGGRAFMQPERSRSLTPIVDDSIFFGKPSGKESLIETVQKNTPMICDEITESTKAFLSDEASVDSSLWASSITCSPTILEDRETGSRPMRVDQNLEVAMEVPMSPVLNSKPRTKCKTRKRKRGDNDHSLSTNRINSTFVKTLTTTDCDEKTTESDDIKAHEMADILKRRIVAALAQVGCIRAKKINKPQPIPGSLLVRKSAKKNHRVSWQKLADGALPKQRTSEKLTKLGIELEVMNINAANASGYRFNCSTHYGENCVRRNVSGLELGDGATLFPDENGFAGVEEFERAFMASPGVDPSLVPDNWVNNHYRWIVWKLASIDRTNFGSIRLQRMLTPDHVMQQLKYRYDREIDRSERPALQKIVEKDEDPSKRLVLCVATISKVDKSPKKISPSVEWKVELTDGWYSITATIDEAMAYHIAKGKVREGTKLVTYGAELLNCTEACSPLEMSADVRLHIHTNSTRRARWYAKLGYQRDVGPIPTSFRDICVDGGLIGKLTAIVARFYPEQYCEKTDDGKSIFRNSRCEQKIAAQYEARREQQIEAMCEEATDDFAAKNCEESLRSISLSGNQEDKDLDPFEIFQRQLRLKLEASIPPPRRVTQLLRVRLLQDSETAILTVWAPSDDIIDIFKEGNCISVRKIQTASRRGELQLTAGRQSVISQEKITDPFTCERCFTAIPEAAVAGFNPSFGEFDTVGVVVSVGPAPQGFKNFEAVYLAYPNPDPSDSTYLAIFFWDGIDAYGFSDILSVGSIVACVNLQWRRNTPKIIMTAYTTGHSTFTRNPRPKYLRTPFEMLRDKIKDTRAYATRCASEIGTILQGTPVRGSAAVLQPSPVADGFGTPKNTTGVSVKSSIQRRLDKLQCYEDPPNLSPMTISHGSTKIHQKFISPLRIPEKTKSKGRDGTSSP